MAEIEVAGEPTATGWRFRVVVREGTEQTEHTVTLERAVYERLTRGAVPPERLIRQAFVFLLEREPKESILRMFDLPMIGRYFPEFEATMRRRLGTA